MASLSRWKFWEFYRWITKNLLLRNLVGVSQFVGREEVAAKNIQADVDSCFEHLGVFSYRTNRWLVNTDLWPSGLGARQLRLAFKSWLGHANEITEMSKQLFTPNHLCCCKWLAAHNHLFLFFLSPKMKIARSVYEKKEEPSLILMLTIKSP